MCTCVRPSTGSHEKLSLCSSYGADVTIDYKSQDFSEVVLKETSGKGANLISTREGRCVCIGGVMAGSGR